MIARYYNLQRHPTVFKALTGLRVAEFDQLVRDIKLLYIQYKPNKLAMPLPPPAQANARSESVR